jgi:hypothetical protein
LALPRYQKTRDAEFIIANTEPSSSSAIGVFFAGFLAGKKTPEQKNARLVGRAQPKIGPRDT